MRLLILVITANLLWAGGAAAQSSDDRARFDARMNALQRSLVDLSAQVERLKASNQELERKLDAMREKERPPAKRSKR